MRTLCPNRLRMDAPDLQILDDARKAGIDLDLMDTLLAQSAEERRRHPRLGLYVMWTSELCLPRRTSPSCEPPWPTGIQSTE